MSPIDFSLLDDKIEHQPTPFWCVVATKTHQIIAYSESMSEDVYAIGHDCYDVLAEHPPEGRSETLLLLEGTFKGIPCGSYDGGEGLEYETAYRGTWRPLTPGEAVALAAGTLRFPPT